MKAKLTHDFVQIARLLIIGVDHVYIFGEIEVFGIDLYREATHQNYFNSMMLQVLRQYCRALNYRRIAVIHYFFLAIFGRSRIISKGLPACRGLVRCTDSCSFISVGYAARAAFKSSFSGSIKI